MMRLTAALLGPLLQTHSHYLPLLLRSNKTRESRTDNKFRALFRQAGLRVIRTEVQKGLPAHLYQVRSYALREH